MFFFVEFDDGDKVLLPYSKDLSSAVQFEEFVYSEPQLFPLRFNAADAPKRVTAMKREPIRNFLPGRGEEREALLQHSSCIMYYWLVCAVTIFGN